MFRASSLYVLCVKNKQNSLFFSSEEEKKIEETFRDAVKNFASPPPVLLDPLEK